MNVARAVRLSGTVEDQDPESYQRGHRDGMVWASEYATADELRGLVQNFEQGRGDDFHASHSLYDFMNGREHEDAAGVPNYSNPFWRGFAAGAEEVLDEQGPPC
jgi:hypothetical protein